MKMKLVFTLIIVILIDHMHCKKIPSRKSEQKTIVQDQSQMIAYDVQNVSEKSNKMLSLQVTGRSPGQFMNGLQIYDQASQGGRSMYPKEKEDFINYPILKEQYTNDIWKSKVHRFQNQYGVLQSMRTYHNPNQINLNNYFQNSLIPDNKISFNKFLIFEPQKLLNELYKNFECIVHGLQYNLTAQINHLATKNNTESIRLLEDLNQHLFGTLATEIHRAFSEQLGELNEYISQLVQVINTNQNGYLKQYIKLYYRCQLQHNVYHERAITVQDDLVKCFAEKLIDISSQIEQLLNVIQGAHLFLGRVPLNITQCFQNFTLDEVHKYLAQKTDTKSPSTCLLNELLNFKQITFAIVDNIVVSSSQVINVIRNTTIHWNNCFQTKTNQLIVFYTKINSKAMTDCLHELVNNLHFR